jgi:hypothetical protein
MPCKRIHQPDQKVSGVYVTPHNLLDGYQHYGRTLCLHLQDRSVNRKGHMRRQDIYLQSIRSKNSSKGVAIKFVYNFFKQFNIIFIHRPGVLKTGKLKKIIML